MPTKHSTTRWSAKVRNKRRKQYRAHNKLRTCHDDVIVGTAPLLRASRKDWVIRAKIGPVITVLPTCLGLVLSKTNFVKRSRPSINSDLNSFNYISKTILKRKWINESIDTFITEKIPIMTCYIKVATNWNLVKSLEILFVAWRPHESEAFSVRKKSSNGLSNLEITFLVIRHISTSTYTTRKRRKYFNRMDNLIFGSYISWATLNRPQSKL